MAALTLREAQACDCFDILDWRNDPETRKHSFDSELIGREEHERWFTRKLGNPGSSFYIGLLGKDKAGTVRFDDVGDFVRVNVMLNPLFRGKGLGAELIRLGTEKFFSEKGLRKPIHAEILAGNPASLKAFEKAGYVESYQVLICEPRR